MPEEWISDKNFMPSGKAKKIFSLAHWIPTPYLQTSLLWRHRGLRAHSILLQLGNFSIDVVSN